MNWLMSFTIVCASCCAWSATVTVGTLTSVGYPFNPAVFTWPASNAGPYTLLSSFSTNVLTPNGAAIVETNVNTHQYQHHTRIFWTNGVTYLAFSSCATNEGDGGEQVWITTSTNRGTNWTAPAMAVPSQSMWTNVPLLYGSNGAYEAGMRVAYPHTWQTLSGTNWLVSSVDESFDRDGNVYGVALLACPVFADGTVGTLVRISTNSYAQRDGKTLPAFDSAARTAFRDYTVLFGTWGGTYHSPTEWQEIIFQSDKTFSEPSTFPTADNGTTNLYRIWRCNGGIGASTTNCYQQYSRDGGQTWSGLVTNQIPNAPSVTCGLRLSTKQFAILGNPVKEIGGNARDPLFLALTEPGTTTITNVSSIRQGISDEPTYPGWGKAGGASYVNAVQVGNYLYVGYSLQKESVGFSRVLIPGLADNNNDQ